MRGNRLSTAAGLPSSAETITRLAGPRSARTDAVTSEMENLATPAVVPLPSGWAEMVRELGER